MGSNTKRMKHLAACMLLTLSGVAEPTEAQVAKLMKDSGIAADKDNMTMMMEKLKGKKIHERVVEGRGKFASMPSAGAAADSKAPAKKEEKVEVDEDENLEGGFDMFGDGYRSHTMVTVLNSHGDERITGNTMKQGGS